MLCITAAKGNGMWNRFTKVGKINTMASIILKRRFIPAIPNVTARSK